MSDHTSNHPSTSPSDRLSDQREREIQLQFLDEAQDYIATLESAVLGLAGRRVDLQRVNAAMRAAHSIKGGAAMMGFKLLSDLAHRLEDTFKVLKTQRQSLDVDTVLEQDLLQGVDCLQYVIQRDRRGESVEPQWLTSQAHPLFERLHLQLGEAAAEDAASVLGSEGSEELLEMLFGTEVEASLSRFEGVLGEAEPQVLAEELETLAGELGGLGAMLQIEAFTQLCESVIEALATQPDHIVAIAIAAQQAWRRSQALMMTHQMDLLPDRLQWESDPWAAAGSSLASSPTPSSSSAFDWDAASLTDASFTNTNLTDTSLTDTSLTNASLTDAGQWLGDLDNPELGNPELGNPELGNPEPTGVTPIHADSFELAHPDATSPELASSDTQPHTTPRDEPTTPFLREPSPTEPSVASTGPSTGPSTGLSQSSLPQLNTLARTPNKPGPGLAGMAFTPDNTTAILNSLSASPTPSVSANLSPSANPDETDISVRVSLRSLHDLGDLFGELAIERNALDLYLERLRSLTQTLKRRVQTLQHTNQQVRSSYDNLARGSNRVTLQPQIDAQHPLDSSALRQSLGLGASLGTSLDAGVASTTSPASASGPDRLGFDILELDRYSDLNLLGQEMMETIVQIQEVTTDVDLSLNEADQTLRNLNKTSKQLHSNLNQLRLRPLSDVLDRFPRAVRELCLQHGKRVNFQTMGVGTLIDRSIIEALQEPLMHLLRNAFDHGIEPPDERRTQGKSEEGTIEIRAIQEPNRTLIQVSDDGRGIDAERIRAKAIAMGLDGDLLANASEADLVSLIFEPGFSTRDQVSELSGRGVGMDVVRDRLRQVRGDIQVQTRVGQGTTFTLALPVSLSVMRVLLVESDGLLVAFPADLIQEVVLRQSVLGDVDNSPADNSPADGFPADGFPLGGSPDADSPSPSVPRQVTWQGRSLHLVVLSRWLQFNSPRSPYTLEANPKLNAPALLVVQMGQQWHAIQIERSWGEQEVAVRRVEGFIPMPLGFGNCTILGDGRVVPLVNVPELLRWIHSHDSNGQTATALPLLSPLIPIDRKPTVLVVDDSINVRRFLALTLEKAGYRVEQAKDGQEALDKLKNGLRVQGVLCDIEMPRLDGYGFLGKLKADPQFQQVPVAMLTSRSGDKHRQLALQLGAIAYFSKPYNEQELLEQLDAMVRTVAVA